MFGRKPDRLSIASKSGLVVPAGVAFLLDGELSRFDGGGETFAVRYLGNIRPDTWQNGCRSVMIGGFRKPIGRYYGVSSGNGYST